MKLKNLIKMISIGTAVALLATTVTPVRAGMEQKQTKEELVKSFNDLQSEIDKVLRIDDTKYVFNKEDVVNVINNYDFDFQTYNEYFHTNYTNEGFADIVIKMIENADLTYHSNDSGSCSLRGTYCGKNGTSSGWNYDRFYNNKTNSKKVADKLDELSRNWSLISGASGGIGAFLPGIGTAIASGIALGAVWNTWYTSTLASAIRSNNEDGNCGTVTDINKFTTVFTVWSQREFNV